MSEEHVDVLIVGAGISGIDAGCRLRQLCPEKSFAILEGRGAIGGTWDQFRFPGIRSDSDMFTLCYPFRPWEGSRAIVDGPSIRRYVQETAAEYRLDETIRFHHRVRRAEWSSAEAQWRVEAVRSDTDEVVEFTCRFLFMCAGYYRYDQGHMPEFPGIERFGGEVVHPQFWHETVKHGGKRVVVIGSGATAVTLVPALARDAAHVTMLQRSPSYVLSLPQNDPIASLLGRVLPTRMAYPIVRWKNIWMGVGIYNLSRRRPELMKRLLRSLAARRLPEGYDVDTHFKPRYAPWDQRMCLVPDNDLFDAIGEGRVSVVTDRIETFTETGLTLASGRELGADMVVTATGLDMVPLGEIELTVDGQEVELPQTVVYRGMMLSGVPNFAFSFGYVNQSWTLGSDLTCRQVCALLKHIDRHGYTHCTPRRTDPGPASAPFADLRSGYVLRALERFPRQGSGDPWLREPHYPRNRKIMRRASFDDPELQFTRATPVPPAAQAYAA
jgi:cation diffusion facilitator CzcD-associated flavoprotein CzcO